MSLTKSLKYHFLWVLYFGFVAIAVVLHQGEPTFTASGPYALGKPLVWLVYLAFLAYSLWVSSKENFFKALQRMAPILWCRQVGIDLYLARCRVLWLFDVLKRRFFSGAIAVGSAHVDLC
ncbi:MAG: hypothetical protein P8I38_11435 [Arenicella sp.]|jgi:hypothetical protein|nr:hypothetical protein [Arenicella sp.]